MSKSADAFRTISEVADWLQTPAHVLRFWESKFTQVKPVKRAGGRRYYRPSDMELLGGIKRLLHDEGMTIKGVQKLLRDKGVAHVAAMSPALDDMAVPMEAEVVPMPTRTPTPTAPVTTQPEEAEAVAPVPPVTDIDEASPANEAASATEEPAPAALAPSPETQVPVSEPAASPEIAESASMPDLAHVPADPADTDFPATDGVVGCLMKRRSPLSPEVAAQALALARELAHATR